MQVHDKPIHEIVHLLNVPTSETLWCDFFEEGEQAEYATQSPQAKSDRDLLMSGTLWITSLGLGLSLYRCKIVTVHLCDPAHAPRIGDGQWTPVQQKLSEAGIAPVASGNSTEFHRNRGRSYAGHARVKARKAKRKPSNAKMLVYSACFAEQTSDS